MRVKFKTKTILSAYNAPSRNVWLRARFSQSCPSCRKQVFNRMICWDSELRLINHCWSCTPEQYRPDARKFPRLKALPEQRKTWPDYADLNYWFNIPFYLGDSDD